MIKEIAIDLGFGYTKAIANTGNTRKVIFPSVIAPANTKDMQGFVNAGHRMEFTKPGKTKNQIYYVGERAIKENRVAQLSLDDKKFTSEESAMMALTAAYLLDCDGTVDLAIGLPISIYKDADYLKKVTTYFREINGQITVDGGPSRYISFSDVNCFPQGVGAVYSLDSVPQGDLIGLLDIGFFTIDLILFESKMGNIMPLNNYFRSIKIGVSRALQLFNDAFNSTTGSSQTLLGAMEMWHKEQVKYKGKVHSITEMVEEAKANTAKAIVSAVYEAWIEKIDNIGTIMLSGGGAIEMGNYIKGNLTQSVLIDNPQFANAMGFLKLNNLLKNTIQSA